MNNLLYVPLHHVGELFEGQEQLVKPSSHVLSRVGMSWLWRPRLTRIQGCEVGMEGKGIRSTLP